MNFTIWNVDTARPVKGGLSYRTAIRFAGLLEGLFGSHYTITRR